MKINVRFSTRRILLLGLFIVVLVIFGGDWLLARARLDGINIVMQTQPESVIANGTDKTTVTVRITENGRPRANDLLQLWLNKGGGLLTPNWVYTDSDGSVMVTYTPNPYSRYDPQDGAEVVVLDISIGRLIEVGKQNSIVIPLIQPKG